MRALSLPCDNLQISPVGMTYQQSDISWGQKVRVRVPPIVKPVISFPYDLQTSIRERNLPCAHYASVVYLVCTKCSGCYMEPITYVLCVVWLWAPNVAVAMWSLSQLFYVCCGLSLSYALQPSIRQRGLPCAHQIQ